VRNELDFRGLRFFRRNAFCSGFFTTTSTGGCGGKGDLRMVGELAPLARLK
jgi:hypothetical protein